MDVPGPFKIGSLQRLSMNGWHITGLSLLFVALLTAVIVLVWGDTLDFPKVLDKELRTSIASVDSELSGDLDRGVIPGGLRDALAQKKEGLSDNATVSTMEEGRRWLITDPEREYQVIKQPSRLEVDDGFFNVSLQLEQDLESGRISESLREGFRSNNVGLSDQVTVSIIQPGQAWLITEPGRKYTVTKENNLNIDEVPGNGVPTRVIGVTPESQNQLEQGVISEDLRTELRRQEISLSDDATLSTVEDGSRWLLSDDQLTKTYAITTGENKLNIVELAEKGIFLNEDIADGVDTATDFVTEEGAFLFDFISDVIKKVLTSIQDALLWLPWPVLISAVALLAWRMAGLSVAVFSAVSLLFIGFVGFWPSAMETLSLMLTSVFISSVIAVPIGIAAARSNAVDATLRPILDGMQTMPSFVYLVPAIFFFGLGNVPAVIATIIYAVPPAIRLTNLGIRQVSLETVEAARAFGATPLQILLKVQIPLALPTIMAGINQTTMMALAMVVVASLVGAGGLGADVLKAIGRLQIGNSLLAGLSIVFLAITIDRITQGFARERGKATQE